MKPISIKLLKKKNQILFYYKNNDCLILKTSFLRALSPSAENKNNRASKNQEKFKDVSINNIERVGNYALRFFFSDGHSTGIYSWEYIIEIGQLNSTFSNP